MALSPSGSGFTRRTLLGAGVSALAVGALAACSPSKPPGGGDDDAGSGGSGHAATGGSSGNGSGGSSGNTGGTSPTQPQTPTNTGVRSTSRNWSGYVSTGGASYTSVSRSSRPWWRNVSRP